MMQLCRIPNYYGPSPQERNLRSRRNLRSNRTLRSDWNSYQQNGNSSGVTLDFSPSSILGVARPSRNIPEQQNAFAFDEDLHWRGEPIEELAMGALVTAQGIISVRLHSSLRVDITVDKAIRIINHKSRIIMALSSNGANAALIHPSGRVYQYGSRVEINTVDPRGNSKYAKMWYKGVSFTSEHCALVYLVDQAGTRTTTDNFSDMEGDFSMPVFLSTAQYGPSTISEAIKLLQNVQYWITEEGVENWVVNGIRVSQTSDGLVRVGRGTSKYSIRTSPKNGTASLTTPYVHCTASLGVGSGPGGMATTPHLFVKRGERRMHYDGQTFIVRNAGHSAGFDENNQLKVY